MGRDGKIDVVLTRGAFNHAFHAPPYTGTSLDYLNCFPFPRKRNSVILPSNRQIKALRGIKAWVCIEKLKVIYLLKHFIKNFQISYVTVIYGHL